MKIVYFTGMYPTKTTPHGGVFITKRMEAVRKFLHQYELYAIVITESLMVKKLRKILKKNSKYNEIDRAIYAPDSEVVYTVLEVKIGLLDKLLNKFTGYKHQANKIFRTVVRKFGVIECDIIHAHWLYPVGTAIEKYAKYCNKPCVITCHGSDINTLLANKKMQKHILRTLRSANLIEFVSKALQSRAVSYGYNENNSVVVPNGVDTIPERSLRSKEKIIVGYVGNLIHIKRADKLTEIITNIMKYSEKPIEFHVIGDGELRANLEKSLKADNVKFFGRLTHSEVLEKMKEMTVMMLPSRNEGWPCVVLEAHSCGVPVVGSSNGGIPEAINDHRLIVGEENFEYNFANRVLQVVRGDIQIDSIDLINHAKNYMWDTLTEKTIGNYTTLIKQEDK